MVFPVDASDGSPVRYFPSLPRRVGRPWKKSTMPEAYCVKCKAKKQITDAVEEVMKNGRKAIKGTCPDCGVIMFKILGGKGTAPPKPGGDTPPASHTNTKPEPEP